MKENIIFKTHVGVFTFENIGEWSTGNNKNQVTYKLYKFQNKSACYMFIIEDSLKDKSPFYVGKSVDLEERFNEYCSDQYDSTTKFVSNEIKKYLDKNKKVLIYFCPNSTNGLTYGEIKSLIIGYGFNKNMINAF